MDAVRCFDNVCIAQFFFEWWTPSHRASLEAPPVMSEESRWGFSFQVFRLYHLGLIGTVLWVHARSAEPFRAISFSSILSSVHDASAQDVSVFTFIFFLCRKRLQFCLFAHTWWHVFEITRTFMKRQNFGKRFSGVSSDAPGIYSGVMRICRALISKILNSTSKFKRFFSVDGPGRTVGALRMSSYYFLALSYHSVEKTQAWTGLWIRMFE